MQQPCSPIVTSIASIASTATSTGLYVGGFVFGLTDDAIVWLSMVIHRPVKPITLISKSENIFSY